MVRLVLLAQRIRSVGRSIKGCGPSFDVRSPNLTSADALLMQLQDYANKDLRSMQGNATQARQMAESNRGKAKGKRKSNDKGEEKGKPRSEPYGKGVMAGMAMITTKGIGTEPTAPHQAQS